MREGTKAQGKEVAGAPPPHSHRRPRRVKQCLKKGLGISALDRKCSPYRDLTRFVKALLYQAQQQRFLLHEWLKAPPVIDRFTQASGHQAATQHCTLAHGTNQRQVTEEAETVGVGRKSTGTGDVPTKRRTMCPSSRGWCYHDLGGEQEGWAGGDHT
ncbi:hypothetical protein P7K49_005949 [Saguinus oedipus]|uniref:Uncharacterized protein n=1 Tax=Saguinus oedipus TaxID=9490 RepID=A0ABQ9W108_SAGOE|nr:hypothetical protein P7K49_005949 [Saguinus oedipus]